MKAQIGTAIGAAIFAVALASLPALAEYAVTERQKRDCKGDYHKYCGEYGLGSEALRACMSRNIKKISHACVGALVDAGEMTQVQADKLRAKAATTNKKKTTSKKPTHKKVTGKSSTSKSSKKKTH
jgi:hypothetical protein